MPCHQGSDEESYSTVKQGLTLTLIAAKYNLLEIRDSQNLAKLRHGFLVVNSFAFVVRAEFQVGVHAEFQL